MAHPLAPVLAYLEFDAHPIARPLLTLLVVLLCALGAGSARFAPLRRSFDRVARRRAPALLIVFSFSFLLTSLLSLKRGLPLPHVHDEFSYLLAADTFARGRLTNPPPEHAEHFETMHVLVRPTYTSKYPPAQGLFMALGQLATGKPIIGVWLSTALACAAICWALYAFVSPSWALLGGLLASAHPQMLEWGNRYWGGSVAVLGGAMMLGALARLMPVPACDARDPRPHPRRNAILLGLGLFIMANSRPFESLLLVLILVPLWGLFTLPSRRPFVPRSTIIPLTLILLLGGAWMGYYNYRVTGNPLRLPYLEHHAQYGVVPLLIIQQKYPEPPYSSEQLRLFYTREQEYWYARRDSWIKLREEAWKNVRRLYDGVLGNVDPLAAAFFILPWFFLRNRRVRTLTLALLLLLLALLTETYMYPHYAAPAAAMFASLLIMLLRRLHRFARPLGPAIARSAIAVAFLWSAFWWIGFYRWTVPDTDFAVRRQKVIQDLYARPGNHLVLVRYGDHNVHEEWVYNAADLSSAKIVWARSLDVPRDARLITHFHDRTIWLLNPDLPGAAPIPIERPRP